MIQFNLLPDVKLEYIKAKRSMRLVVLFASLSAVSALAVVLILAGVVYGVQRKYMNDLTADIKKLDSSLQSVEGLEKILTVQNQLNSLTELHEKKPVASRLFGFLTQVTPSQAKITKASVDFATNSMTITGTADALSTVNKYADTLKFTTYKAANAEQTVDAFRDVVLKSFTRSSAQTQYEITAVFDPVIFSSAADVKLSVPQITSTRSETEKPGALFEQQETKP